MLFIILNKITYFAFDFKHYFIKDNNAYGSTATPEVNTDDVAVKNGQNYD